MSCFYIMFGKNISRTRNVDGNGKWQGDRIRWGTNCQCVDLNVRLWMHVRVLEQLRSRAMEVIVSSSTQVVAKHWQLGNDLEEQQS